MPDTGSKIVGTRGPLPKRASAGHRPKSHAPDSTVVPGAIPAPELPEGDWHPRALDWWDALARSGQSVHYEPSDWNLAVTRFQLEDALQRTLEAREPVSATMLAELGKIDTRLGVTENDRRRMRVAIERPDRDVETARGDAVGDRFAAMRAAVNADG